ncbi:MAG: TolC family protein [Kiritimatiellae bacterium]|nr:TolC family protein [Kiritimatiellia bacterium]
MFYSPRLSLAFFVVLLGGLLSAEEQVEPLSLADYQAFALEYAPGLARQHLAYSNLVESVEVAKAAYDPVFQVRRGWQETDAPGRTTGSISQTLPADLNARLTARTEERAGDEFNNYALSLSKTILGGGTFLEGRLPLERAWVQEAKEANTLSLEQRRLYLTVVQRYYSVVRNELTLSLRELQLERAKRNLEHAMVKEDPLDIATAELRIPESELEVLSARRAIHSGLLDLANTVGMPVSQPIAVQTELDFTVEPISLEQDLRYALENHEQILSARLDLELSRMESRVARTQRLPEVRVEVTLEENETPTDSTSEARGELILEWPWLDRRDRAEARQRKLDVEQNEIRLFEALQEVQRQIETMAQRVDEAERSVTLQEERVRLLERQYELYQDRWDNGEINILEFIRSQNDLENARVQLVTQQTRYLELRAEYDFLIGR